MDNPTFMETSTFVFLAIGFVAGFALGSWIGHKFGYDAGRASIWGRGKRKG